MTPLRGKYIRDLTVRGRAQRTQRAYTRYVSELAHYYQRSPELISYEEVTNWLYHLIKERQLSASSVNVAVNAVRFLYGITLGRNARKKFGQTIWKLTEETQPVPLLARHNLRSEHLKRGGWSRGSSPFVA